MSARTLTWLVLVVLLLLSSSCLFAQQTSHSRTVPAKPVAHPATPAPPPAPQLAMVNGQKIGQAELDRYVKEKWGRQVLDDVVDATLVRQAAAAKMLTCSEAEIDQRVAQVKQQLGGVAEFNQMLRDRGISHMMYRSELKTQILLEKLMDLEFAVSEAQARAYYEDHLADYQAPGKVHLFDIVTDSVEKAAAARQQIADGKDFQTVAQAMSTDGTAELGGDRGWLTREDIADPLVREVAFALQAGQVSNPLKVGETYHVLYASEVEPAKAVSFDQARMGIANTLRREKSVGPEVYVLKLRRKADIQVLWKPYSYMTGEYLGLRTLRVAVDDKPLRLAPPPLMIAGRMMVPAKPVLQAIGAFLSWKADTQTLRAEVAGGKRVEITLASATAVAGTQKLDMGVPAQLREGTLWIAPRVVVEALGGQAQWDEYRNTLFIKSPAAAAG